VTQRRRPFRFSVQLQNWADRDELVTAAREAETLGYDEIYAYDHFGTIDPFVPLVVAAEATTTIKVGPLVLNNEFHHPALLARAAATVDRLTGGRLVLGWGTGYAVQEHDAIGLPLRPPGRRVSRFAECVAIVRDLLDTGASHRTGAYHSVAIDDLGVRPAQARVPILIGGFGRRVIGVAAQHADIVQFTGLADLPDGSMVVSGFSLDAVAERARWLSEAAGERDADIERSALVQFVHVGADAPATADLAARFEIDESAVVDNPFVLAGTVEQIVDQLERIRERTGVSHYTIRGAARFAPIIAALAGR
jgi:probable F420-dependent oxidoreductase